MKDIINLILEAEISGLGNAKKQLESLSKGFGVSMSKVMERLLKMDKMFKESLEEGSKKASKKVKKDLFGAATKGFGGGIEFGAKALTSALADAKGAFQGIITGALTGVGDVSKKLSKSADDYGKKLMASKKKGEKGYMGAQIKGGAMRGMGALVGVMGSLASAIALVVKSLFDAEAKAKELNNAILDGGIAGGDLAKGMGKAHDALEALRTSAVSFKNNMAWGTLAKDQVAILGAFNATGYVLKEMTKNTTDSVRAMQDYQNVTRVALTYAKLLGMTSTEMATQQGEYMESLGGSLSFVEQQFSEVFRAAQMSGFGVKRFYSMVQQATSGMAMYNVRMDEAAGLLLTLGNILGSKVAGDFLAQLSKGFMDQGMTERYKTVMLVGVSETQDIMYKEALNTASAFGKNLSTQAEGVQDRVGDILGIEDLDLASVEGQGVMVEKLARMADKDKAIMIAKVSALDKGLGRELSKLSAVSEAQLGGVMENAEAMDALGPGGTLAMQLGISMKQLGKPLHELDKHDVAGFEAMAGISGEQRVILTKISEGMYGQFDTLTEMKDSDAELGESLKSLSEENNISLEDYIKGQADGEELSAEQLAAMQEMQERFGGFIKVTEDGNKIVKAQFDSSGNIVEGTEQAIGEVQDFIMAHADKLTVATETAMDENTAIAQEIARNTTDLAKIMEMGVEYWLEQIYKIISPLVGQLLDFADPAEVAETTNGIMSRMEKLQEKSLEKQQELNVLERELATTQPGADTTEIEASIKAKKEEIAQNAVLYAQEQDYLNQVQMSLSKEDFVRTGVGGKESTLGAVEKAYDKETASVLGESVDTAMAGWVAKQEAAGGKVSTKQLENLERELYEMFSRGLAANTEGKSVQELMASALETSDFGALSVREEPQAEESFSLSSAANFFSDALSGEGPALGNLAESAADVAGAVVAAPTAAVVGTAIAALNTLPGIDVDNIEAEDLTGFGSDVVEGVAGIFGETDVWGRGEGAGESGGGGGTSLSERMAKMPGGKGNLALSERMETMRSADFAATAQDFSQKTFGKDLQDLSSEELNTMGETLGLGMEDLEDLITINEAGLTEKTYADLSEDEKRLLKNISDLLPNGTLRSKENKELADEFALAMEKRRILSQLTEFFGEAPVPEGLVDVIASQGYAAATSSVPAEYQASFAKLSPSQTGRMEVLSDVSPTGGAVVHDFISRPGREPISFDSADTLLGAKVGGPIDKMMAGGGKGVGAGGGAGVTINIYGSQGEIYTTVKRVLTETGAI